MEFDVGFDEDGTVGADGERGAQGFLAGGDAAADGDDFRGDAGFFQTHRFFHRNFVKRVHAHLDVRQINPRAIRLHSHLHVVVNHPLHGNENLH